MKPLTYGVAIPTITVIATWYGKTAVETAAISVGGSLVAAVGFAMSRSTSGVVFGVALAFIGVFGFGSGSGVGLAPGTRSIWEVLRAQFLSFVRSTVPIVAALALSLAFYLALTDQDASLVALPLGIGFSIGLGARLRSGTPERPWLRQAALSLLIPLLCIPIAYGVAHHIASGQVDRVVAALPEGVISALNVVFFGVVILAEGASGTLLGSRCYAIVRGQAVSLRAFGLAARAAYGRMGQPVLGFTTVYLIVVFVFACFYGCLYFGVPLEGAPHPPNFSVRLAAPSLWTFVYYSIGRMLPLPIDSSVTPVSSVAGALVTGEAVTGVILTLFVLAGLLTYLGTTFAEAASAHTAGESATSPIISPEDTSAGVSATSTSRSAPRDPPVMTTGPGMVRGKRGLLLTIVLVGAGVAYLFGLCNGMKRGE